MGVWKNLRNCIEGGGHDKITQASLMDMQEFIIGIYVHA
jgi:hypothetical protein